MSKRNNLIQTIKQEEKKKNLYLDSLQLLLKLKTIQNTTPGRVCLQEVTRQYTKVVSLWIVSQLVWASLRTIKPREDDLARCRRKPGHNTSTRHHVGVNRRVLKANALVRFSPVELPICNSLSLSFSADFVKNTTEIKHMHVCCNAMARYTEYQSIALPFQHEWWFSRSTFRWGEQNMCLLADLAPQSLTTGVTFLLTGWLTRAKPLLWFPFYCEEWWLKFPSICSLSVVSKLVEGQ